MPKERHSVFAGAKRALELEFEAMLYDSTLGSKSQEMQSSFMTWTDADCQQDDLEAELKRLEQQASCTLLVEGQRRASRPTPTGSPLQEMAFETLSWARPAHLSYSHPSCRAADRAGTSLGADEHPSGRWSAENCRGELSNCGLVNKSSVHLSST
eukprot:6312604-Amphidinium_carterae.1